MWIGPIQDGGQTLLPLYSLSRKANIDNTKDEFPKLKTLGSIRLITSSNGEASH